MRIFLSYASAQRPLAERINQLLQSEGHSVFFDREDLPAGETYGDRIREAVENCHAFIYLVGPESISPGSYALTELALVERLPRRRAPAMIPVLAAAIPSMDLLPPFLAPLTLLEPRGDPAAEVAAKVADIANRRSHRRWLQGAGVLAAAGLLALALQQWHARPPAPPPPLVTVPEPKPELKPKSEPPAVAEADRARLVATPTNQGWLVTFDIAAPQVREIFYALDDAQKFTSTGFHAHRHPATGLPLPQQQIVLPGALGQTRTVSLKYTDGDGREHGPYRLPFDPRAEYVRAAKSELGMVAWLSFRENPRGKLRAYFTPLVSRKNAFREIRYSVDDESLAATLRFTADWSGRGSPGLLDSDVIDVEIPPAAKYVAVKLFYIDGSESELKRVLLSESEVAR